MSGSADSDYTGPKQSIIDDTFFIKFPEWEDDAVSGMWLMDSPIYVITLCALYLWFVTSSGPRWMSHRPAFSLKTTMMIYNFCQISVNIWFLFTFLMKGGILPHLSTETCSPAVPSRNQQLRLFTLHFTWVWWLVRVMDLFDTVIFVLRKKQSHVTFLHVYHHFVMVLFGWFYFKYVRGESLVFAGLINSFVHVVMYSYYLLAALGPRVQRYLWWKRYLTRLQLVQFSIVFCMHVYLALFCTIPRIQRYFIYFTIFQNITFFSLFLNFYIKAYSTSESECIKTKTK